MTLTQNTAVSSLFTFEHPAIRFDGKKVFYLDQTQLPAQEVWHACATADRMIGAIQTLQVRGAPLIGVAASLAVLQEAWVATRVAELINFTKRMRQARPTAVNLMNCLDRLLVILEPAKSQLHVSSELRAELQLAVERIALEDVQLCLNMAKHAQTVIQSGDRVITHCNSGALATAGLGTALGAVIYAHKQGKRVHVYADETRPLLQGGRLSAWELSKAQVPHTLICDNMAGALMAQGKITKAFVGADRIARNGDAANKIGTYGLAVLCHYHHIPFYVVAPTTTLDLNCATGAEIPIEERSPEEVYLPNNNRTSQVFNPAFDVTPHSLITGIITDTGVYTPEHFQKKLIATLLNS